MGNDDSLKRKAAWSAYWADGTLHSCASSYHGNYRDAIADFWRCIFKDLPSGSRVLDIATGNGALPLLLWQQFGQLHGVKVDAVDFAEVAPSWPASEQSALVNFHPGVSMEDLPFKSGTFDLVVSQYGIEYGKWPDAVAESIRVCGRGGRLAFVVHHVDSALVRVARSEQYNHMLLAAAYGLMESARHVIPWIAAARSGISSQQDLVTSQACRAAYNLAMAEVGERIDSSDVPDLLIEAREHFHRLVSQAVTESPALVLARLDTYSSSLEAAALRTAEMIAHALDQDDIDAMKKHIEAERPDWNVTVKPVVQSEGILGWSIVAALSGEATYD